MALPRFEIYFGWHLMAAFTHLHYLELNLGPVT